jgi:hypothetical protein
MKIHEKFIHFTTACCKISASTPRVEETFSEKRSWIYTFFCYFAFHVFNTPFSLENFDPCNFPQGAEKGMFFQASYAVKNL